MLNLFGPLAVGIVVFVAAAILAFEIAMFVSLLRNQSLSSNAKVFWAIGMLLFHPFVAIAYYFTDYKKS